MTHFERGPRLELKLASNMPGDWWTGDGPLPPMALVLDVPGEDPASWPFWKSATDVSFLHREIVTRLAQRDFKKGNWETKPLQHRQRDLRKIAEKTHDFLRDALMSDAPTDALTEFTSRLNMIEDLHLYVSSDLAEGGVPWAFLHPTPVPERGAMTAEGFLGFRFMLVEILSSPRAMNWGEDALSRPTSLGMVDDLSLTSVQDRTERTFFGTAVGARFDPLHAGDDDDEADALASEDELAEYLVRESRMAVHFACHGAPGTGGPDSHRYRFQVRRGYRVDTDTLKSAIQRETRKLRPFGPRADRVDADLLFLNMCGSAASDRALPQPARSLDRLGPRGVIGTTGDVCELVAVDVAIGFYQRALQPSVTVGQALSDSVRAATQDLNPVSLLYVFRGDPEWELGA